MFMVEINFSQVIVAPKYWETLEQTEVLALVKTPLQALANDLWYVSLSLPQERPSS